MEHHELHDKCLSNTEILPKCTVAKLHQLRQSHLRFGLTALPRSVALWYVEVIYVISKEEVVWWQVWGLWWLRCEVYELMSLHFHATQKH